MSFSTAALLLCHQKFAHQDTKAGNLGGIKNLFYMDIKIFYMDIKRMFSAIPNLKLGCKCMALNLTLKLKIKFSLNCILEICKFVNIQFTCKASEVMKLKYLLISQWKLIVFEDESQENRDIWLWETDFENVPLKTKPNAERSNYMAIYCQISKKSDPGFIDLLSSNLHL